MKNTLVKTGSARKFSSNDSSPTSPHKRLSTFKNVSPQPGKRRESFAQMIVPFQNEMVLSKELREMAEIKEVQENREKIVRERNRLAEMIAVLNKSSEERSQADLDYLANLVADVAFFKNLEATRGRDRLLKCLSRLTYSKTSTNQAVFCQGEIGTEFYIILKGRVKVSKASWVNLTEAEEKSPNKKETKNNKFNNKEKETDKDKSYPELIISNKDEEIIVTKNDLEEEGQDKKKSQTQIQKPQQQTRLVMEGTKLVTQALRTSDVAELHEGDSFGEIALLKKKARGATIYALEDCHFAVLQKLDFERILSEYEERLLDEKLDHIASLKIFNGWNYHLISKLYYHLGNKKVTRNTVLYQEAKKAKKVYIVKSGEFTLYRKVKLEEEPEKGHKLQRIVKKPLARDLRIAIFGEKEFLGEEDILSSGYYTSTAICTSAEGELLTMNKKDFINHVWWEEGAKFFLRSSIKLKLKTFEERTLQMKKKWTENKTYLCRANGPKTAQSHRNRNLTDESFTEQIKQYYPSLPDEQQEKSNDDILDISGSANGNLGDISPIILVNNQLAPDLPLLRLSSNEASPILNFLGQRKDSINLSSILRKGSFMPSIIRSRSITMNQRGPMLGIPTNRECNSPFLENQGVKFDLQGEISPIRMPSPNLGYLMVNNNDAQRNINRTFNFNELNTKELLPIRHTSQPDIDEEKFSLGGRSRNLSVVIPTMPMVGLNLQVSETYFARKSLVVAEEEDSGAQSIRDGVNQQNSRVGRRSPRRSRASSDGIKHAIPRIKADAKSLLRFSNTQSRIFEKNSISRNEDGTPALRPMNPLSGRDSVIGLNQTQREREKSSEQQQTVSFVENQVGVHPKVQLLGSFRTKLKEDITKYQGLKKHFVQKSILERDDITQKEAFDQMYRNKQRIQLVFGGKMFSKMKKDSLKRILENKRKKEQILKPFMLQEGVHEYLEGIIQPSVSVIESSLRQSTRKESENSLSKSPPPAVLHTATDELMINNSKLPFQSLIKPWGLSENKNVNRAKSTFLIRQKIYSKEIEDEKGKATQKLYGKLSQRNLNHPIDRGVFKRI